MTEAHSGVPIDQRTRAPELERRGLGAVGAGSEIEESCAMLCSYEHTKHQTNLFRQGFISTGVPTSTSG